MRFLDEEIGRYLPYVIYALVIAFFIVIATGRRKK